MQEFEIPEITEHDTFKCQSCGGEVKFLPGTDKLKCEFCEALNDIGTVDNPITEIDFNASLNDLHSNSETMEAIVLECNCCGAHLQLEENLVSGECDFCGTHLTAEGHPEQIIKPQALLPLKVTQAEARIQFQQWLASRWFLPGAVKSAKADKINANYMPYWTYDSNTITHYRGQRGEYYYVTETYTVTVNGKSETRTRQVRKTRWYPASGCVRNSFDDILVLGSQSLPRKYAEELEPWDLNNLVPYNSQFLAGHKVECYSVDLKEGFFDAKTKMADPIERSVRYDIGGDVQRITSMDIDYRDISYKHILLPVWISCFRYKEEAYRFLINARTGEVQGERPWCPVKITLATLVGLGILAAIYFFATAR